MKFFVRASFACLAALLLFLAPVMAEDATGIFFQAQVQDNGWLPSATNDGVVGDPESGKNIEAFQANLPNGIDGIRYAAHVSDIGWQNWAENGEIAGTIGQNRPIEAVTFELTGGAASTHDIYYRVYVADTGWYDWVSNGIGAGTTGQGLPIRALQIRVLPKGTALDETSDGYVTDPTPNSEECNVVYRTHVSYAGWMDEVSNGMTAGTVGEGRPIEAIRISAPNFGLFGDGSTIQYQTHIESIGWTGLSSDGQDSGTVGQNLAVQAIKVSLTGQAEQNLDVYYRVHAAYYGWLDWAKNGAPAGSEGLGVRIEAMQIRLVPKGSTPPGDETRPYYNRDIATQEAQIMAQGAVENIGWLESVGSNQTIGTTGQGLGLEALKLSLPNACENSGIEYNTLIEDISWQGYRSDGETAGTEGQNKQMEAVTIELTGAASHIYDVYYQAHCQDHGWLGWAKNGEWAGTENGNKKLEALHVVLTFKGEAAPGSTENAFIEEEPPRPLAPPPISPAPDTSSPAPEENTTNYGSGSLTDLNGDGIISADEVPGFDLICAVVQHEGGASYESALAVMSCVMNRCDSGRWGGTDPVSVLTAPGQFASYLDGYYKQFLGNSDLVVQEAVIDCINGKRSHPYESFRSYPTSGSVNIGGNWYF